MGKESLEQILETSFLDYSAFVLQRRALPDVRDGLKYTGRQILHAQYREKLDAAHPFKKSQKSVAAATAFSYVHGDSSAYGQIIRMGRPLVQRYFLESIQGNGGTPIDSNDYAPSRYTECRLSPIGTHLFDLIKDEVLDEKDWEATYDEEGLFPKVLPSIGYYNLVNGSFGSIGVGLMSSIPQFNLKEMNEEIVKMIDDPNRIATLYPDFASGGILLNPKTTLDSLSQGEGKSALLRGRIKKHTKEGYLQITELPYSVYTNTVCGEIERGIKDDPDCPITELKDLTKTTVNMRIYSKNLDAAEQWLYDKTSVQKHYTIKVIMLKDGKVPRVFTLTEAIRENIAHNFKMLRKHYLFQLEKLKIREEIIEGFLRAYSILDEIIETIKSSSDRKHSIQNLVSIFDFTELQAAAIVDLRLHRLSKLDVAQLKEELEQNRQTQKEINTILNNEELFKTEVKRRYEIIAAEYGDARRTEIVESSDWEGQGSVDKVGQPFAIHCNPNSYQTVYNDPELRGIGLDEVVTVITNKGRFYTRKGKEFHAEGEKWTDLLSLKKGEEVINLFTSSELNQKNVGFLTLTDTEGNEFSAHKSFLVNKETPRGRLLGSKKKIFKEAYLSSKKIGATLN